MNLETLIQQMQQPEFYPHPVQNPITVMQTHTSCVFLTGEYAYKVKKPVNFGFLDYSTLEKRQHFLGAELDMNQETAPDLYLEVLPLTQDGEKLAIEGSGEVVDYALKMRQFPQSVLFSEMLEQGELSPQHIIELGQVVAEFHKTSKTNPYIDRFGEVEQIKQAVDENYQQTESYIGTAQSLEQFKNTKAFTDQFFATQGELFKQRQKAGKIRECHGDLHLRNICFWQGKVQLFDRIEFNEPFRFVDTFYDVAFAIMDLDARGRKDLGNLFLNTYLEVTADWEGLQVLPLYLSRQAYVRAKVTSFLLNDPNIPESEREKALETAKKYYKLADDYTKAKPGQLILMSGLSGAGKTTVARHIAQGLQGIHLRSDAVRKHLAGIALNERGSDDLYTPEMNQKTYERLAEVGIYLANLGYSVVLDAKYDRLAWRSPLFDQKSRFRVTVVYCSAPLEVLRDRLQQRVGDISDATVDLLQSQQANFEDFTATEREHLVEFDTTQGEVAQLLSQLERE
ncbi:AAA family ATPase [Spirulina subsalsa FACHB-351]|uniref:gluconokinase n=1 Tax=Spirulina subsalsa FACHB-351 TaxID=234711 RepID=A0ABT3L1G5_9CYAN|nr:AAA family ATPase [Spirulina subsalsa]MCW6035343.1 AAA family ATPase [Spirulina subsalsa FACHB-351]